MDLFEHPKISEIQPHRCGVNNHVDLIFMSKTSRIKKWLHHGLLQFGMPHAQQAGPTRLSEAPQLSTEQGHAEVHDCRTQDEMPMETATPKAKGQGNLHYYDPNGHQMRQDLPHVLPWNQHAFHIPQRRQFEDVNVLTQKWRRFHVAHYHWRLTPNGGLP